MLSAKGFQAGSLIYLYILPSPISRTPLSSSPSKTFETHPTQLFSLFPLALGFCYYSALLPAPSFPQKNGEVQKPEQKLQSRRRSRTLPHGRKRYEEEPRDRYHDSKSYRDRHSPAPPGLLVRNLPLDTRSLLLLQFVFFFLIAPNFKFHGYIYLSKKKLKYLCCFWTMVFRPEDLRAPFERFGQVKDVYLPKNYYSGYDFSLLLYMSTWLIFRVLFYVFYISNLKTSVRGSSPQLRGMGEVVGSQPWFPDSSLLHIDWAESVRM